MIELVQQHHPNLGEKQVRKLLNRAIQDFSAETEIYHTVYTQPTIKDQRYYLLDTDVLYIKELFVEKKQVPRLIGGLPDEDPDDLDD